MGEFKKLIDSLGLNEAAKQKIMAVIMQAGEEFPCSACPSKDTCENFKWFIKWFSS